MEKTQREINKYFALSLIISLLYERDNFTVLFSPHSFAKTSFHIFLYTFCKIMYASYISELSLLGSYSPTRGAFILFAILLIYWVPLSNLFPYLFVAKYKIIIPSFDDYKRDLIESIIPLRTKKSSIIGLYHVAYLIWSKSWKLFEFIQASAQRCWRSLDSSWSSLRIDRSF
jgi:hypothetical protein